MYLYFVRHGQSVNNALWAETGSDQGRSEDPELTDLGFRQAERVAQFLRDGFPAGAFSLNGGGHGFGITHLYSSMMIRAVATGMEISKSLGIPLIAWEEIHEEGGIFLEDKETGERVGCPGCDRAYFQEHFPDFVVPDSLEEQVGWWNSRPFELDEDRLPRARSFLQDLLERHGGTDDRVAIVSHGGFYNLLIRAILKLSRNEAPWFLMNNTAISQIRFDDDRNVLLGYTNRTDFLPPEMIT